MRQCNTHKARAGGGQQLSCLRNTHQCNSESVEFAGAGDEALFDCLHKLGNREAENLCATYRASRGGNLSSILRETGCLDHEHPQLLIGQRIWHLQLQGDPIGLAKCQHLNVRFRKITEFYL